MVSISSMSINVIYCLPVLCDISHSCIPGIPNILPVIAENTVGLLSIRSMTINVIYCLPVLCELSHSCIPGIPNILTVIAENTVGLVSRVFFPTVVVDNTPPTGGTVSCPNYIQV